MTFKVDKIHSRCFKIPMSNSVTEPKSTSEITVSVKSYDQVKSLAEN